MIFSLQSDKKKSTYSFTLTLKTFLKETCDKRNMMVAIEDQPFENCVFRRRGQRRQPPCFSREQFTLNTEVQLDVYCLHSW